MPRDGSCAIRAVVRLRPLLQHEVDRGDRVCCEVKDANNMIIQTGIGNQWRQYSFDACLPMDRTQKQTFQESGVAQLLDSALLGYSATVLAYGQTGSGKTYTMVGRMGDHPRGSENCKNEDGLVARASKRLFRLLGNGALQPGEKCTVSASFTEIFNAPGAVNECICDLLNPDAKNLQVRHNKRNGFFVSDLCVVDCESAADVRQVLEEGVRCRRVASHALNKDSSRSHALFTLHIDVETPAESEGGNPVRRHGKLTFVDLAGSERLKESAAEGHTLKETQAINKSLFTLGQVISQLSSGKAEHVPYRNSKLTQLLQESFGGEALCLMVTCISPAMSFAEESLNSLRYATKAMNIRNMPVVRLDERQQLVHDLKAENMQLKRELSAYREVYGSITPRGTETATALSPAALGRALSAASAAGTPAGPEEPSPMCQGSVARSADGFNEQPPEIQPAEQPPANSRPASSEAGRARARRGSSPSPGRPQRAATVDNEEAEDLHMLRQGMGLGMRGAPEDTPREVPMQASPSQASSSHREGHHGAARGHSKPPPGPAHGDSRGRSEPPRPEASSPASLPPCPPSPQPPPVAGCPDSRGRATGGSYAVAAARRKAVQEQRAQQARAPARPIPRRATGSVKGSSLPPLPDRSPSAMSLDALDPTSVQSRGSSAGGRGGTGSGPSGVPRSQRLKQHASGAAQLAAKDAIGAAVQQAPMTPPSTQDARPAAQYTPPPAVPRLSAQVPTISAPPSAHVAPAKAQDPAAGGGTEVEEVGFAAAAIPKGRPCVISPEVVKSQLQNLDRLPWSEWQFKFDGRASGTPSGSSGKNSLGHARRPLPRYLVEAPPSPSMATSGPRRMSRGSSAGMSSMRSEVSEGSPTPTSRSGSASRLQTGGFQDWNPQEANHPGHEHLDQDVQAKFGGSQSVADPPTKWVPADLPAKWDAAAMASVASTASGTPPHAGSAARASSGDASPPPHGILAELSNQLSSMQDATSALCRKAPQPLSPVA